MLYALGYLDDANAHQGILEAGLAFLEGLLDPVVLARIVDRGTGCQL